jgi:hypothetical protein
MLSIYPGMRLLRYFPIGHVPYLMFVMCHPQMLALQRLCFNCSKEDLFFGQVNLNSKKPGHGGGDTSECFQSRLRMLRDFLPSFLTRAVGLQGGGTHTGRVGELTASANLTSPPL